MQLLIPALRHGRMDMTGFRMIPAEWLMLLVRSEGGRICCDFNGVA
jgi:hypothetical protein